MRYKLLALTAMSLTTALAPQAFAQSADPVTLYGQVRIAFESVKAKGGATNMPSRNRVEDQSTLFGIRGAETISPELTAFFQIESQVVLDGGTGTLASRNSAVGLRGKDWGSISLGRWDTPVKQATTALSPFGEIQMVGIQAVMNDAGNFHLRPNNSVMYNTPTWGGVTARLHYSANEARSNTANPSIMGTSVVYDLNGFQAGYGYEEHKDRTGSETTVIAGYKESNHSLFGKVTMGSLWVSAIYQEYKKTNQTKQKAIQLAANYTVGNSQFKLIYAESKDGAAVDAAAPKSKGLGLGWYYALSKRTTLTTVYGDIQNNAATNRAGFAKSPLTRCSGATTTNCVANDGDSSGFSVGFIHTF